MLRITNYSEAKEMQRMRAKLATLKMEVETMEFCITDNTLNGIVTPASDRDLLQSKKYDIEWLEMELRGV